MKDFQVTSRFIADKEHGVTNKFTVTITAESEEAAKQYHKEDIDNRHSDNLFYGGVYKQDVTLES